MSARAYLLLKPDHQAHTSDFLALLKKSPFKVIHSYRNLLLIEATKTELKKLQAQWQQPSSENHDWQQELALYVTSIRFQACN